METLASPLGECSIKPFTYVQLLEFGKRKRIDAIAFALRKHLMNIGCPGESIIMHRNQYAIPRAL